MKKQMNLLVATFLAATTLFAATPSSISVSIEKGNAAGTIQVELNGLNKQNTQIAVQDMNGKQWFTTSIKKATQYAKEINLSEMPSGEYVLFVKNRNFLQTRAFQMNDREISFFEKSNSPARKGGLVLDAGGKRNCIARISNATAGALRVQLSNIAEYQGSIQLVALNGKIKYQKMLEQETAFAQNLDLNTLSAGAYVLYIKIGDTALMQDLSIRNKKLELGAAQKTMLTTNQVRTNMK